MSNFHLIADPTPLTQANKLELGFRQLQKTVERKFGKKEDPSIVKGDTELDSKLSMYKDIEDSIRQLMCASRTIHVSTRALANQDALIVRFIQENYNVEGDAVLQALSALAESFRISGAQWNTLKESSDRVQRDYITFFTKGIGELKEQIEEMEEARTDYRAALSWLRATAVDPDKLGQIEKFRRVQSQVKTSKEKFDRMKWAIQTKIDLLRVSRAALLSNAMAPLYRKVAEYTRETSTSFKESAETIHPSSVSDYDYKILKELKVVDSNDSDPSPVETEAFDKQKTQPEEQINDDMLLLDISDDENDCSNLTEQERLISDFLGKPTNISSVKRDEESIFTDDLLQDFSAQSPESSAAHELIAAFREDQEDLLGEC